MTKREWKKRVCMYLASCLDEAPDWLVGQIKDKDERRIPDEDRMFAAMQELLSEMERRGGVPR